MFVRELMIAREGISRARVVLALLFACVACLSTVVWILDKVSVATSEEEIIDNYIVIDTSPSAKLLQKPIAAILRRMQRSIRSGEFLFAAEFSEVIEFVKSEDFEYNAYTRRHGLLDSLALRAEYRANSNNLTKGTNLKPVVRLALERGATRDRTRNAIKVLWIFTDGRADDCVPRSFVRSQFKDRPDWTVVIAGFGICEDSTEYSQIQNIIEYSMLDVTMIDEIHSLVRGQQHPYTLTISESDGDSQLVANLNEHDRELVKPDSPTRGSIWPQWLHDLSMPLGILSSIITVLTLIGPRRFLNVWKYLILDKTSE